MRERSVSLMSVCTLKYFNPKNYVNYARRWVADLREARPRRSIEECFRRYQVGFSVNSKRVILCEGSRVRFARALGLRLKYFGVGAGVV